MAEARFPKGIIVKIPKAGTPDFVISKVSIKRLELIEWLSNETKEWVNMDLKRSKEDSNKLYLQVDDWVPNS